MKRFLMSIAAVVILAGSLLAQEATVFQSDPNSDELRALAKPLVVNEDDYGCGPLLNPGRTFHVTREGDDKADGLSSVTAWRSVARGAKELRAGDTLLIGEGEYTEPQIEISDKAGQEGAPGRPIRIMAAPRARVILNGARAVSGFEPVPGSVMAWQAQAKGVKLPLVLWESDTKIMLEYAGSAERVNELPGTFWIDSVAERLLVRFSDSRARAGRDIRVRSAMHGLNIRSRYIHVQGVTFSHYNCAVMVQPKSSHITIEGCEFIVNDEAGIQLRSAQRCLVRGNYGEQNGLRGCIFMQQSPRDEAELADNLIINNRLHNSVSTQRASVVPQHFSIHHWNGSGLRNHIINNILDDTRSLWYKPVHRQVVIQGNVLTGDFSTTGSRRSLEGDDRMIVRNNTMLGGLSWEGEPAGPGGINGDWAAPDKAFINNYQAHGVKGIAEARFADPAYYDYRLQPDSPLIGKALGGGDRGARRWASGAIYYVGAQGNDKSSGDAASRPLKTLSEAVMKLKAGETLYVLPGAYAEPLVVTASGEERLPIRIRAHGRSRVTLPSIEVFGAHVEIEGFTVLGARGDGVVVRGPNITLRHCLIAKAGGAAVRGIGARELALKHCTLADSAVALQLEGASTDARVRDSILAGLPGRVLGVHADSTGFVSSHTLFHEVTDSAPPVFANGAKGDYSIPLDSTAAVLTPRGRPAGSEAAQVRAPVIEDAVATGVLPDSVAIRWTTPLDDTTGEVLYRAKGTVAWQSVKELEQGTIHGAGIVGLKPETDYEFQVVAKGRRGGESRSAVAVFRTLRDLPPPATWHVAPDGDDADDGRTRATAWRTLRKASIEVAPGDTVLVAPGVYHHPIIPLRGGLPGRRITFRREGVGTAQIFGGGVVAPLVDLVAKSHITIDGFTLDIGSGNLPQGGMPPQLSPGGVFLLSNCEEVEILNCRGGRDRPLGGGLGSDFLTGGRLRGLRVENCISWGARYHIRLGDISNVLFRNNTFVHSQIIPLVMDGRVEKLRMVNNLWYRPCGSAAKDNEFLLFRGKDRPDLFSDHNIFFSPIENHKRIAVFSDQNRQPVLICEDFAAWQDRAGYDRHGLNADPLFVDVIKGDFRLQPGSPALTAGEEGGRVGALGAAE